MITTVTKPSGALYSLPVYSGVPWSHGRGVRRWMLDPFHVKGVMDFYFCTLTSSETSALINAVRYVLQPLSSPGLNVVALFNNIKHTRVLKGWKAGFDLICLLWMFKEDDVSLESERKTCGGWGLTERDCNRVSDSFDVKLRCVKRRAGPSYSEQQTDTRLLDFIQLFY